MRNRLGARIYYAIKSVSSENVSSSSRIDTEPRPAEGEWKSLEDGARTEFSMPSMIDDCKCKASSSEQACLESCACASDGASLRQVLVRLDGYEFAQPAIDIDQVGIVYRHFVPTLSLPHSSTPSVWSLLHFLHACSSFISKYSF